MTNKKNEYMGYAIAVFNDIVKKYDIFENVNLSI